MYLPPEVADGLARVAKEEGATPGLAARALVARALGPEGGHDVWAKLEKIAERTLMIADEVDQAGGPRSAPLAAEGAANAQAGGATGKEA